MKVLVINAGSSSVKYQLIELEQDLHTVLAKGLIEEIGTTRSSCKYQINEKKIEEKRVVADHSEAVKLVLNSLKQHNVCEIKDIVVVGHRVVHGGDFYKEPALIDDTVMKVFNQLSHLAPLHNPSNIKGIEACKKYLSHTKQVAVFDTSFHQNIPQKANLYALPFKYYEKDKVRRYGFHGISHEFLSQEANKLLHKEKSKIITCHLGNGSSVTAVLDGKSVDTSMGFTPLEGLIMGTRCGDIDPGVVLFLMNEHHLNPDEMKNILNKKSGFIGIAETSDVRELWHRTQHNDEKAKLCLEILEYMLVKKIAAYAGVLNGIDALVFSGGIGENAYYVRESVCKQLSFLGINLDEQKNKENAVIVSKDTSKVKVFVIPTNEELLIAQKALTCYLKTL